MNIQDCPLLLFESWGHVYADPGPHEIRHALNPNKPISKDVGRPRNLINKANYKWSIRTTLIEKNMSGGQISNNEIRPAPVVRCERLLYLVHVSTLRITNEGESKNNIQCYLPCYHSGAVTTFKLILGHMSSCMRLSLTSRSRRTSINHETRKTNK